MIDFLIDTAKYTFRYMLSRELYDYIKKETRKHNRRKHLDKKWSYQDVEEIQAHKKGRL